MNQILVSDEYYYGQYITKFPGGGMEFGETTIECLKREWAEELKIEIEVGKHIHTSEVFQAYPFRDDIQIISIYYFVRPLTVLGMKIKNVPFDFPVSNGAHHNFAVRWIDVNLFNSQCMTLLSDKMVTEIIRQKIHCLS
jgi:8-oxo-dGTP pyrophosphatase MutT (NUDIX family)